MKPAVFDYAALARRIRELNGKFAPDEPALCGNCGARIYGNTPCGCTIPQPTPPAPLPPPAVPSGHCPTCNGVGRRVHPHVSVWQLPCSNCHSHAYPNPPLIPPACPCCYDVGWIYRQNASSGNVGGWHVCHNCGNPQGRPCP